MASAALVTSAPPAHAADAVLYDQTADVIQDSGHASAASPSLPRYAAEGADDFTVPVGETWTITTVVVVGEDRYLGGDAEDFVVNFYADAAGHPDAGAVLATRRATVATAQPWEETEVMELGLALGSPVTLGAGTYWLGVQAQAPTGTSGNWYWLLEGSDRGADRHWRNPGGGYGDECDTFLPKCGHGQAPGYAFRLLGDGGPGVLSFDATAVSVDEGAGTAVLEVVRTGGSAGEVSVTVVSGAVTAQSGVDYVSVGEVVSFAAGETSKTVEVTILDDAIFEGDETFHVFLSGATGGATIAGGAATVTIEDDETSSIRFSSAVYDVSERYAPNGRATITVTRAGDLSAATTVDYSTSNGSALSAKDYVDTGGTLSFAPGESEKTFQVRILRDTSTEGTETVVLALSDPGANTALGAPNASTLNINDQT